MLRRVLCGIPLIASVGCAGEAASERGASSDLTDPGFQQPASSAVGLAPPAQNGGVPVTTPGPSAAPALPAEVELSFEFELPHAGERYVYAVNPESDSVAVIDAVSLAIHSVEAGDEPTFLQTLAGRDAAIVLNVRSSDATLIRTEDGSSRAVSVPVQVGANAIAVAPDGKHAVVYFDSNSRGAGASGSFQDISVLFLEEGEERAEAMTVGFRPSAVSFSSDGKRAFVVTEDGVSLLDFAEIEADGPAIARTVALGDDATASLDVSVTPDGKYALARREGDSQLRLANLETDELTLLDLAEALADVSFDVDGGALSLTLDGGADADVPANLDAAVPALQDAEPVADAQLPDSGVVPTPTADATPGVSNTAPTNTATAATSAVPPPAPLAASITDVDLAPSGDYALAVVRDQSTVLQVDIPGAFDGSSKVRVLKIGTELVGSVSIAPDSNRALLYTTAVETQERISVLDLATGEYQPVRLPKSVESVTIADNSATALIVHKKLAGSPDEAGITPDVVLDRSYGYSILDLDSGFSKLQTTPTSVGPSTIVPDGSNLFVLFNDKGLAVQTVHQVNLQSFVVKSRNLGSPPTSIGSVPSSKKVFVGQEHPDGRITFIDWETGVIESVTGFELNSRIRE
jgi:WD40 repeat protein